MGSFFTSICAQASKTAAVKALKATMKQTGFQTNSKNPEITLSLQPCGGKWLSIRSDDFDWDWFGEFMDAFSIALQQPALAVLCFDSDFVHLDLHCGGESDTACIGQPYDGPSPEPNPDFWRQIVPDWAAFSKILNKKYVFAEEGLLPLGDLLGFDGNALLPSEAAADSVALGFSRPQARVNPRITAGPVRLGQLPNFLCTNPYSLYHHSLVSFTSLGGPGKGLKIIIEAAFPDGADLPFEIHETHIRHFGAQLGEPLRKDIPAPAQIEFECAAREGGRYIWQAVLPDFPIPDGFDPDYKYPSRRKSDDNKTDATLVFNYRLCIPAHLSELNFRFIPLENPEGEYLCRLEDCWPTPQEQEIFDRDGVFAFQEYMRKKRGQNPKGCT